jgi:alpha-beta hydrolase superfamily lysophospholipase
VQADEGDAVDGTELRIDVSAVAPAGVHQCAVEVFVPDALPTDRPPLVAFCLPGGYSSRGYFDLRVPAEYGDYSMARHLAGRGLVVANGDPPGVGASDGPDDPFTLTPDVLADLEAAVTAAVLDRLTTGTLVDGLGPVPDAVPVGVGHSAGALLTVYEQARHRPFAALALLGFSGSGLVDHLTAEERAVGDDADAARAALPWLVQERFGSARPDYPQATTSIFSGGREPEAVKDAVRGTRAPLLALLGLTAMIPGASAPELAAIDVPVFLGVGDEDITGDPRAIPGHFPNATDVTLFVLAGSGHAHNIAPRRVELWDRFADWAGSLAPRTG